MTADVHTAAGPVIGRVDQSRAGVNNLERIVEIGRRVDVNSHIAYMRLKWQRHPVLIRAVNIAT